MDQISEACKYINDQTTTKELVEVLGNAAKFSSSITAAIEENEVDGLTLKNFKDGDVFKLLPNKLGPARKLTLLIDMLKAKAIQKSVDLGKSCVDACAPDTSLEQTCNAEEPIDKGDTISQMDATIAEDFSLGMENQCVGSPVTIPKYSIGIQKLLDDGSILKEWDKFIEETAYYVLAIGQFKTKDMYADLGRMIFRKYPCIGFPSGKNPWAHFTKKLSQKIRNIRWKWNKRSMAIHGPIGNDVPRRKKAPRKFVVLDEDTIEAESNMNENESLLKMTTELEKPKQDQDKAMLLRLQRNTFKKRRQYLQSVEDGNIKAIVEKYPILGVAEFNDDSEEIADEDYMILEVLKKMESAMRFKSPKKELDLITVTEAPRITYLHVQSTIKARFATTLITSKVVNLDRSPREVIFDVIIPEKAFISGFNLDIDGRIYPSEVQEKEEARRKYNNARSRGISAGQISRRPRETNKFSVEVNIAPRSIIIFNLTYEEFLQRNKGIYRHMIYIDPGQIVDDLRVDVSIMETRPITTLRVPPLTTSVLEQSDSTSGNSEATIVKPTSNTAEIDFRPTVEDQKQRSSQGISGQFVVEYDVERQHDVGDMLVVGGFFVHYFAPKGLDPIPKDVVFVLDISGSMGGQKIAQLKTAMNRILSDLHENDRFTIVSFSSSVGYFRRGLIQATSNNVEYAKAYMRRIHADGGTNINDGVLSALRFIKNIAEREGRSPIVVFLTDGQATSGETNNAQILENVKQLNDIDVPIFSLAFGRDADYEFVKTVSVQNHGIGQKIYETSDADLQISRFYDDISVSLFRNVSVTYKSDEVSEDNMTETHFNTYFKGSEIVVAGVVKDRTIQNLDTSIDGVGSNGSLDFTSTTLTNSNEILENADLNDGALSDESIGVFSDKKDAKRTVEKIWSHLTLREILRKLHGESNVKEWEALKKKALEISLKYGIVTPLTSLIVSKPDEQDLGFLQGDEADLGRPPPTLPPPGTEPDDSQTEGKKRRGGGGYGGGGDPHFMVHIPGLNLPICFDIMAKPGEFLRILKDPLQGMIINAATIPTKTMDKFGKLKTYIGEIFIKSKDIILVVTPTQIIFNGNFLSWLDETPVRHGIVDIQVRDSGYILAIHLRKSISVIIRRIPASDQHPSPYLNIFIQNKNALSLNATGILGQFAHKHVKLKKINERGGKTVGRFRIHKGNKTFHFKTNLKHKHAYVEDRDYPCWNAHRSISGLIDGQLKQYIIQSFFDET